MKINPVRLKYLLYHIYVNLFDFNYLITVCPLKDLFNDKLKKRILTIKSNFHFQL